MPKSKPLTRVQQRENTAFLRHLRRTGNAVEAARALGFTRERFIKRRNTHRAFAVRWDAALVEAHANLNAALSDETGTTLVGRDRLILRGNRGRLQLRATPPSRIGHAARQRFLAALSASANVHLSAAAAGFSATAFYRQRRRNPAFAREWRLALQLGYDRLELALLEGSRPETFTEDDWRRNDPPAIPPMTANQALQLLYLHQKEARLWTMPLPLRLRPGETQQARSMLLQLIHEGRLARDREAFEIAQAERLARDEREFGDREAEMHLPPDLGQVTGWSRADPAKTPVDPTRAPFGGWRLKEIPEGQRSKRR